MTIHSPPNPDTVNAEPAHPMTTDDPTSSVPITPPPPPADRDPQRAALRDLVALAARSAATESEVESRYTTALDADAKAHDNAVWTADQRHKQLREAALKKHADQTAAANAKFESDRAALAATDRAARDRAAREYAAVEKEAKYTYDQAVWLAQSVYDAEQIDVETRSRQADELSTTHKGALAEREKAVEKRLEIYGRGAPPRDDVPDADFDDPSAAYDAALAQADTAIDDFSALILPKLVVGATPVLIAIILAVAGAVAGQAFTGAPAPLDFKSIGIGAAAGLALSVGLYFLLNSVAHAAVNARYRPVRDALDLATQAARARHKLTLKKLEEKLMEAAHRRDHETKLARDRRDPLLARAAAFRDTAVEHAQAEFARHLAQLESARTRARADADAARDKHLADLDARHKKDLADLQNKHDDNLFANEQLHNTQRAHLEQKWSEGLARIQSPLTDTPRAADPTSPQSLSPSVPQSLPSSLFPSWSDPAWSTWTPPKSFPTKIRFGELQVDLPKITDQFPKTLKLPETFSVPATLTFPDRGSLLIHTDRTGRDAALATLQNVMLRLLTALPAGRVRFTLMDPVGLGRNFAGFMHLADYDDALVGARIWTDAEQIDRQLADLTEHMETVIQKYLRNEFETIDDYNRQAGELAEPYRYVVIADLPVNFSPEAMRRLASIVSSGARCGVYALILRDVRHQLPQGSHLDEIEAHSVNLIHQQDRFVWKDEVFRQFPLKLDEPPAEDFITRLLHVVGKHAKESKRVEVPFETIAPRPDQFWSLSTKHELSIPVGRQGATRLQSVKLGKGMAQHVLIAGKTGSGKSTLLHALVTNLAMWYSPDEVEFYLVDFKKGVEFKTYATHALPHARAIAVESDREFGLSVLHRLDAELTRRGALYRQLGVQDLSAYREAAAQANRVGSASADASSIRHSAIDTRHSPTQHSYPTLPRTLLIIDEFQEFFSEDDKLAQEAQLLLDRLVRQGRAFGIHILLGSQTIGGTSGLARSTIGQMAVRIALQTSEADSHLILADNNAAARLLSRPGEAIYNDAGGLIEANSPFQVAWLPDPQRDRFLQAVESLSHSAIGNRQSAFSSPIVFEGNAPADITKNTKLTALLNPQSSVLSPTTPATAYLGDPVAIKDPTSITLRRQAGANALIVGQQDEPAMALMASALLSLAAQFNSVPGTKFLLLDGSTADSPLAGRLPQLKDFLPTTDLSLIDYRGVDAAFAALAADLQKRQDADHALPPTVVFIYALQRYRMLRKSEDSYSFSSSDEEKAPAPDKLFATLLREGPALGIHFITWCDTPASVERTFDRSTLREFDHRILFQMSATDSSNLIDSPAANKLGFHRALAYSEEQGTLEKFRPYALPPTPWLEYLRHHLTPR